MMVSKSIIAIFTIVIIVAIAIKVTIANNNCNIDCSCMMYGIHQPMMSDRAPKFYKYRRLQIQLIKLN